MKRKKRKENEKQTTNLHQYFVNENKEQESDSVKKFL
jgi:hypothetical protein